MTAHKHLKDTARHRSTCYEMTYQQALREIVEQINWLDAYPHLAIMWELGRSLRERPPGEAQYRAALGAIELALRERRVLDGVFNCDRWRSLDGHVDLGWEGGPFAEEVVRLLIDDAEQESDHDVLSPGEITPGVSTIGDVDAVWISGVRVKFRPLRPVGLEASQREMWARIRRSP